ncbi:hypothetical protein [Sandarakinorhabdus sp. DWP1-3-1]|uniref:hypothetical protein n=1 Tax=Sandarakinorhabdus sp. DWP1-3-1 TaxID=2804627 RepID=UPI003CEF1348
MHKVDGKRQAELFKAANAAMARWKQTPIDHLIFHNFVDGQRNSAVKEYRFAYSEKGPETLPMLIGGQVLQPIEAVQQALDWWRKELDRVEEEAYAIRKTANIAADFARQQANAVRRKAAASNFAPTKDASGRPEES